MKMPWSHDSDWTDERGRHHIESQQMAAMYRHFHALYNESYWQTASNHKLCEDAIQALKTTHISGKPVFLHNYVMLLRETYSHAHYNIFDLLCDDRRTIRLRYWQHISTLYRVVLNKTSKAWSVSSSTKTCTNKLAILLHFASLYSIYKDVAHSAFIAELTDEADRIANATQENRTPAEREQIREYLEAIHMIYKLRHTQRRRSFLQRGDEDDVRERSRSAASDEGGVLRPNVLAEIMAETSDDDKLMKQLEDYRREREAEKEIKAAARAQAKAQRPSSSSLNTVEIEIDQMKELEEMEREWDELKREREAEREEVQQEDSLSRDESEEEPLEGNDSSGGGDEAQESLSPKPTFYEPQGQSELFRSVANEMKLKLEQRREEEEQAVVEDNEQKNNSQVDSDPKEKEIFLLGIPNRKTELTRTRSWQPRGRKEEVKERDEQLRRSVRIVDGKAAQKLPTTIPSTGIESKHEDMVEQNNVDGDEPIDKTIEERALINRPSSGSSDDILRVDEEPNPGQFSRRYAIRRRSAPVITTLKESCLPSAVINSRRASKNMLESIQESR